jgi:3-dehydroquinate dehydratase-2
MANILVLNGPNLNLLGSREPEQYGHRSLNEIMEELDRFAGALRDALLAVDIPFVEVHLSAIAAREPFRQISYFSDIAMGVISGFQGESYMLALQAIINLEDS